MKMSNNGEGWQELTLPLSFLEEYLTELGRDSEDLTYSEELIIADIQVDIEKDKLYIKAYVQGDIVH